MKSKYITHIILEGTDGVGKDTVAHELWQDHSLEYRVYVRGELSDWVYAKKFNRQFNSTQRGLPFIYVLLTCDEEIRQDRIRKRGLELDDLKKNDQILFINAMFELSADYHILLIDTTNLSVSETADTIKEMVREYSQSLAEDTTINEYNNMYKTGCDQLGIKFSVRGNQPFFDEKMIMADAQLHNGVYETFSDKTVPHNLIFSFGYQKERLYEKKRFDFCYIIGSKISVRQEVNEYFETFFKNHLSCLTRETYPDKVFGDDYIKRIAQAEATVYCCRDLAYLKMITVRPYEAALAGQIMFVDKYSDPNNEILKQIHKDNSLIDLLYVTPETIAENYRSLTFEQKTIIRLNQIEWYRNLKSKLFRRYEK